MYISKKALAVIGVLVIVVATVGIGYAQGNEITACVKKNGQVRFLTKENPDCEGNETPVTWNVQGPQGPKGDKGDPGQKGDQGDPGPQGLPGVIDIYVTEAIYFVDPGFQIYQYCYSGDKATGGGYYLTDSATIVRRTAPFGDMLGWTVAGYIPGGGSIVVYAVCADITP